MADALTVNTGAEGKGSSMRIALCRTLGESTSAVPKPAVRPSSSYFFTDYTRFDCSTRTTAVLVRQSALRIQFWHTASLLEENTDIQRQPAERLANVGSELRPRARHVTPASSRPRGIGQAPDAKLGPTTSDPNIRATATGNPAAIPRERLFQRLWPRMMIGVMFVLEVAWIVFLVHSSITLVRFHF
jgi:hypothetical protein